METRRYFGKGTRKAVGNINREIAAAVRGLNASDQVAVDRRMRTIDNRVRRLENRFCNEKPQLLRFACLAGWGLALDQDRCIEILGECGFSANGPVWSRESLADPERSKCKGPGKVSAGTWRGDSRSAGQYTGRAYSIRFVAGV